MVNWSQRLCALFSNKEAVTVILWYAACISVTESVYSFLGWWIQNYTIYITVTSGSIIFLYLVLGLFGEVFIGRYRLIQFSLWIKFMTVIVSSFMTALLPDYHFLNHVWLQIVLFSFLCVIEQLGQASFHVVAIQFGTDQLQGAPSDHLSAFVFWYIIAEIFPSVVLGWVIIALCFIKQGRIEARINLVCNLLSAIFVSVLLSIKNCFMSKWFVTKTATSPVNNTCRDRSIILYNSNPYRLIYHVLKFAKEHKSPIQRSALTYWEDKIPSRIDLGKKKYGGPFTNEEVENVKTFLQLLKLLFSLSGILITSYLIRSIETKSDNRSKSCNLQVNLIYVICLTATTGLLILCHISSCFHKCRLSMLKRIGIGAALTVICAIINLVLIFKYTTRINKSGEYISPLVNVVPNILSQISYIVLTVSLFEFIIAQSPHSMKGMLIGFYYIIYYGLTAIASLIGYYAFQKLPCTTGINCSASDGYIVITIIALLSFIMYCIVAYKYKLRERDEVVNVHIFAEEYYGNREDDLDSDGDQDVSDSMIEESIT